MDKEILKDWMERFFNAELTVDEERELYRYLCANEVPAELRKDREVILVLCSKAEEDIELPEGAAERLEAMLDGLEEMKEESLRASLVTPPPYGHPLYKQRGSLEGLEVPRQSHDARSFTTLPLAPTGGELRFRMTKVFLRAACAAAVVAAVFLAIPNGDNKHAGEETMLAMVDDVDKDTFDNPEEAMQCLKAAYGDMMLAVNTARDNTREACLSLEQSQTVLREMFNVNIN